MTTSPSTPRSSASIGLPGLVFLVFLVLKLVGVINWSWWWVTAPLWAGAALALAIFLLGAVFILLTSAVRRRG